MAGIGVVFLVLWGMCFVVVALRDENANHWDWPTDHGPSALVNVKLAAVSAFLAGIVLAVLFGFGEFVKYLASL